MFKKIFQILILVLLALALVRFFFDKEPVTLSGFLQYISSAPTLDISTITKVNESLTIEADWGILNFIRDYLNAHLFALGSLAYIGILLINTLLYIVYFVAFVFVS